MKKIEVIQKVQNEKSTILSLIETIDFTDLFVMTQEIFEELETKMKNSKSWVHGLINDIDNPQMF